MGSPGDLNSDIVALHSNQFLQASHPKNRSTFCQDLLSVNIWLHNLDWALNTALIYYMSCKKRGCTGKAVGLVKYLFIHNSQKNLHLGLLCT